MNYSSIALCWVITLALVVGTNAIRYYKSYSATGFYLYYDESGTDTGPIAQLILTALRLVSGVPLLLLAIYLLIYFRILVLTRLVTGSDGLAVGENKRHERRFLLMSFLICSVYIFASITFYVFPLIATSGQAQFAVNFVGCALTLALSTVHSVMIFAFNSTAREELARLVSLLVRRDGKLEQPTTMLRLHDGGGMGRTITHLQRPSVGDGETAFPGESVMVAVR